MKVPIAKFPSKASEQMEYMDTIRSAAKTFKSVSWVIHDYKFRQQVANNKSLSWARIDQQLWLKIFCGNPAELQPECSRFSNGPSSGVNGFFGRDTANACRNFSSGKHCPANICKFAHKCNRPDCGGDHPGFRCTQSVRATQVQPTS